MQKYIKVCLMSRGYDPDFTQYLKCDLCEEPAVDIDHLNHKDKKRSTHLEDPLNLQPVCRYHHSNKGGWDEKERREQIIAQNVLKKY